MSTEREEIIKLENPTQPSQIGVDAVVSHCCKCDDELTGHEDESKSLCRWCVTGWESAQSDINMIYNKKANWCMVNVESTGEERNEQSE